MRSAEFFVLLAVHYLDQIANHVNQVGQILLVAVRNTELEEYGVLLTVWPQIVFCMGLLNLATIRSVPLVLLGTSAVVWIASSTLSLASREG